MPETISLQCLKLSSLSSDDILALIDPQTISRIKATDAHPFFQAYSICHEGVSQPTILGEKSKPIHWTRAAVESIKNVVRKGIKFFRGHNKDNSTDDREALGEIVADTQKEIDGKLHHIVIGYFPDKAKVESADVCSQEADWNLFENAGKWFAGTMQKLTGIALSNSAIDEPAFEGAVRLGMVQAFVLQAGGPGSGRHKEGGGNKESKEDIEKSIKVTDDIGNVTSKAGYVSITKESDPVFDDEGNESEGEEYLRIDLVYTKPEYRGQGYAEKMLDASLDVAEKTGMKIKLVALPKDSSTDQNKLIKFYESMGFSGSDDDDGGQGFIMEYGTHNYREKIRKERKNIRAQAFTADEGDKNNKAGDANMDLSTISFSELAGEVKRRNTFPHQLFSLDEIKRDKEIIPIIDELDKLRKESKEQEKKLKDSEAEKIVLSKRIESVTAKDKLSKILTDNKLVVTTDKQRKFIESRFKGIEDTSDEGFKKYIETEIEERKKILDIEGLPKDDAKSNEKTSETSDDMTKAANNPLLEEDFNS